MKSKPVQSLLAIALLSVSAMVCAEPVLVETRGHARDLKSGQLIYTEHHRIVRDGRDFTSHLVEYRDPAGQLIASKNLDYSRSRYAPAFRLEDKRDGYVEGAEYTSRGYRLFYRKSADHKMKAEIAERSDREMVNDAGFNLYMFDNLERLNAGEILEIDLCVAERQTSYVFRGYKSGAPVIAGQPAIEITTEPNSRLIRLLVDPLKMSFDSEAGRLLAYEGTTNIRDEKGKRHVARIVFPLEDFKVTRPAP